MSRRTTNTLHVDDSLERVSSAVREGMLSPSAAQNIGSWLTEPWYSEYRPELVRLIDDGDFARLDDLFWRTLPFGTAGRRGPMAPLGCNAVNSRTIGETVMAIAAYLQSSPSPRSARPVDLPARAPERVHSQPTALSCAIAYDCRHRSREFAELSARILAAAGFQVYFLDGCRSTPVLAFTVRTKQCNCGIMISASHNPPCDNAIKVFWDHGGQIMEPHDREIMQRFAAVRALTLVPFEDAVRDGTVHYGQQEMDRAFCQCVVGYSADHGAGSRDLRILYSSLHGVGQTNVMPVLSADGFRDLRLFADHASLDPDFSNVPDQIANPEQPRVFDPLIDAAADADLILASDPDADRIGAAARRRIDGDDWHVLNGNQIAVLLAEFLLRQRSKRAELTPDHFLVTTRVTTPMLARIARHYGVRIWDQCPTGFKWIAPVIDRWGPDRFVLGCEEAHGYLVGDYIRDKDAAGAAMVLAEFAAHARSHGRTLWDELDLLYLAHGYHGEQAFALPFRGADGTKQMFEVIETLRNPDRNEIAGYRLVRFEDSRGGLRGVPSCSDEAFDDPQAEILFLQYQPDSAVANRHDSVTCAVRPSGTEPKLKFYLFAADAPVSAAELPASKRRLQRRLVDFQSACRAASETLTIGMD